MEHISKSTKRVVSNLAVRRTAVAAVQNEEARLSRVLSRDEVFVFLGSQYPGWSKQNVQNTTDAIMEGRNGKN